MTLANTNTNNNYQAIFARYETKYMITKEQKQMILEAMEPYMQKDRYFECTIRNIYFDTDNYRLIRHSLEKPVYKEKLRIRSYSQVHPEDPVFVELKKKYDSTVYKRRIELSDKFASHCFRRNFKLPDDSQIASEIDYFRSFYGNLKPSVFLTYDRQAYASTDGQDFRVTFDENILYRTEDFSLGSKVYGTPILPEGVCLMELKCHGGIPLWMTKLLTDLKIYKTSFSKYGTAYTQLLKEGQLS